MTEEQIANYIQINSQYGKFLKAKDYPDVASYRQQLMTKTDEEFEVEVEELRKARRRVSVGNTIALIEDERIRQIEKEGFSFKYDDQYTEFQLVDAAICLANIRRGDPSERWPWDSTFWKNHNPRTRLIQAAALLVAEIQRRDRLAVIAEKNPDEISSAPSNADPKYAINDDVLVKVPMRDGTFYWDEAIIVNHIIDINNKLKYEIRLHRKEETYYVTEDKIKLQKDIKYSKGDRVRVINHIDRTIPNKFVNGIISDIVIFDNNVEYIVNVDPSGCPVRFSEQDVYPREDETTYIPSIGDMVKVRSSSHHRNNVCGKVIEIHNVVDHLEYIIKCNDGGEFKTSKGDILLPSE